MRDMKYNVLLTINKIKTFDVFFVHVDEMHTL